MVSSEVIEHVDEPWAFTAYCSNLVKEDGDLIFTTLNRTHLSRLGCPPRKKRKFCDLANNLLKTVGDWIGRTLVRPFTSWNSRSRQIYHKWDSSFKIFLFAYINPSKRNDNGFARSKLPCWKSARHELESNDKRVGLVQQRRLQLFDSRKTINYQNELFCRFFYFQGQNLVKSALELIKSVLLCFTLLYTSFTCKVVHVSYMYITHTFHMC